MAVFKVATAAELNTALGNAKGGDRIVLQAGDYGQINISNRRYASEVMISSEFRGNVNVAGLFVSNSENLTFNGLDLGRALQGNEPDYTRLNTVQFSASIKIVNSHIHGSLDGNPTNDGIGLYITDSKNVDILNNRFTELLRGTLVQRTIGVTLASSHFDDIRSDGANFTGNDRVTVRNNVFKGFARSGGDHADAIQFWNTGQSKGQSDIVIRDNIFVQQGSGEGAQGIFISDPSSYGYKNVLIQNNVMYANDDYNGIMVHGVDGLQILNNTVLSDSQDSKQFWIRVEVNQNVVVRNNLTDNLLINPAVVGLISDGNLSLASVPALGSRLDNLDSPGSVRDLLMPGVGFQLPNQGAVSQVLGSDLADKMLQIVGSGKNSSILVSSEWEEEPFGRELAAVTTTSSYQPAAIYEQPVENASSISWQRCFYEHYFVALP